MKTILVIEDNDDIRNNTAEILELSNYTVILAQNGKVGVARALEKRPDLIICDIMMPELDGYGVLHAIHQNELIRNTPFIFLTAKTERSEIRKGMELGADDYLTKPFDGTELLQAVSSRLKKVELLKQDLHADLSGVQQLLVGTGKRQLQELTEGRNINRYKKKQTVYAEGNHPNRLYFVVKGKVKAYKTNDDGKELITELYCKGDFVGHIALLEKSPYRDTTEAMEETELAVIPREDFDELIDRNPEVARKFIQLLAQNISEKESQLVRLAYNSLRKKVADALLTLKSKYGSAEDKMEINISRDNLATIAGTATESLIRTLSDFRAEKLIDIVEGRITIVNLRKLETLLN